MTSKRPIIVVHIHRIGFTWLYIRGFANSIKLKNKFNGFVRKRLKTRRSCCSAIQGLLEMILSVISSNTLHLLLHARHLPRLLNFLF